ncbi:MAG: hypothetical protein KDJ77_15125 [Rhodobiaceae bacterium]|nr:hypothetical protein [Rhodobiaceae bacterium]
MTEGRGIAIEPTVRARARRPARLFPPHGTLLPALIGFLFLALSATMALAAIDTKLEPRAENGFGRLVFSFPKMPKYDIEANAGVLVISFDESIKTSLEGIDVVLSDYFSVGRIDPDGKAIRFALVEPIRVNAIEAGNELFVDLLPSSWKGAPPALPEEVIRELARRAEEAERTARDKLLREQMLRDASDVTVSVGRLPTFTRVQFDWPVSIKFAVTREDDAVKIQFDRYGIVDLSDINVQPTAHLLAATDELTSSGLLVTLKVNPEARIRTFREGESVIIDISVNDFAAPVAIGNAVLPRLATEKADMVVDMKDQENEPVVAGPTGADAVPEEARSLMSAFDQNDISSRDFGPQSEDSAVEDPKFAPDSSMKPPVDPKAQATETGTDTEENLTDATRRAFATAVKTLIKAENEDGQLKLTFPFDTKTPLAAFARANVVWLVFDTIVPFDMREVRRVAGGKIADISQTRTSGVTILRFVMSHAALVTASPLDKDWTITIGDVILEPTEALHLVKGYREDGEHVVTIDLKDPGSMHAIADPVVGDTISVVTAYGPPRGLVKRQELVDFTALASAQGVVIVPTSDSVRVEIAGDRVVISKDGGGLVMTTGDLKLQGVRREVDGSLFKSNYVNFDAWANKGETGLSTQIAALELAAAQASDDERDGVRLAAARLLMASGFYTEAAGLIRLTAEENEAFSRDPTFLALRGVNNVLLGHVKEARPDLTDRRLRNSLDTRLWLGLADAMEGNWRDAQVNFSEAETAIAAYPEHLQSKFRFAAAEAALNTGDMANVNYQLDTLVDFPLSDEDRGRLEILQGRNNEAMGQSDEAIAAYQAAIGTQVRPIVADARWRLVRLQAEKNKQPIKDGIEQLETLIALWRGDDIELHAMETLANLYIADAEPRRAFDLLKTALKSQPDNPLTREFQDNMSGAFADLYLKGGADKMSPVTALALFYDFRDLTPVGRDGDEMIRRLSERLISVDLLDQAAELLSHQVANRLKGAARAQVATQLAMVHLMNRDPAEALRVLQQSRQAVLPVQLQRQRLILEARALAETGRVDLAIERLKSMEGEDVDRLRADVLWRGENWQAAATQIENMLADVWSGTDALSETQRQDVMRAAIGYSLAGDELGLDRLRRKFTSKMAESVDASAFNVVTAPISEKGVEFRQMVRKVADTDTLQAFIADYRKRYDPAPTDIPEAKAGS